MPSYKPHEYAIYKKELEDLEREIDDFNVNLVTREDVIQALKEKVREWRIRMEEPIKALSMENKKDEWVELVDRIQSKIDSLERSYNGMS